jgi:hypothetical protein
LKPSSCFLLTTVLRIFRPLLDVLMYQQVLVSAQLSIILALPLLPLLVRLRLPRRRWVRRWTGVPREWEWPLPVLVLVPVLFYCRQLPPKPRC